MEHPFEQHIFDGYERNFSTPDYHSFASELREEDRQLLPQLSDDEASTVINYTIIWKLQLRKGRVTKLTEDTIEDVDVAIHLSS
jgi:cell division septal protein FtsQ